MRKKLKTRLLICLTLIVQLFCSVIGVQAETGTLEVDHHNFRWRIGFKADFHDRYLEDTRPVTSTRLSNYAINGVNAYCIEPNVELYTNFYPVLYRNQEAIPIIHKAGYSDTEIHEMALISSLGYGYKGDFSEEMNAATQVRIWQVHFKDSISKIPSEVQKKIDLINERLQIMKTPISFANQTIVLEGMGSDHAVTIEDTNNVLKEYVLNSVPNGVHVEIENNVCRIWLDETAEKEGDILLDALYSAKEANGGMIAYAHPKNQTLASFEKVTPTQAKLHYKYEEPKGSISIYKHGEKLISAERLNKDDLVQTKFEYKDDPIGGVCFNLKPKEDIKKGNGDILYKKGETIEIVKTDEQGFAKTSQLPYGVYLLQELEPATGYVKNKKEYEVSIDQNGSHLKQISIENKRKSVQINVKKQSLSTKKPLKNCKFGIYTVEDIVVGSSIIPADTLIESVLSDEDGNVTFQSDLPFGKYKIIEMSCPDAYKLTTDCVEIDMSKMKSDQTVLSINHLFENEFRKVNFFIEKVNEKNEKILNKSFEFGLYKDEECIQLIQSKRSDSETSKIEFNNLDIGVYYVKEIKAPEGYECTNDILKLIVTEEGKILLNDEELKKENGVYVCSIMNKSISKLQTGYQSNRNLLFVVGLLSLIGGLFLKFRKKN